MSDRHWSGSTGRQTGERGSAVALQRTLKSPVQCSGVGLHSGRPVSMTLFPAGPDHGIQFRRLDSTASDPVVPALWHHVVQTNHCTVLGNAAGVTVSTVEHLMAALAGAAVDNCLVALDGGEVPIMDGSAAPFLFLIECAGTVEQNAARRAIQVKKPVLLADGGRVAALSPADSFSISFEIEFDAPAVARQECFFRFDEAAFRGELSRARTFGFAHEVEYLRARGLALGGSLDNAVVIDGDRVLNDGGLRYPNEFVRHKVLDCIGDLYLAGASILGHFHGVRSGHGFNNKLLKALFADKEAWAMVPMPAAPVAAPRPVRQAFAAEPVAVPA